MKGSSGVASRETFAASTYFPSFDGVRTIAFLVVIASHLPVATLGIGLDNFAGFVAVHVFFLISGFLITTLLLREEASNGRISFRDYFLRRLFRIFPVYYFVFALYIVICQAPPLAEKWAQLKAGFFHFLFFFQEYAPASAGTIFGQTWSLGVEEKFYLLWPFVFFGLLRTVRARWILLPVIILSLWGFGYDLPLCRAYTGIAVGCLLAVALDSERTFPWARRLASVPAAAVVALVIGSYLLVIRSPEWVLLFHWTFAYLLLHFLLCDSWTRRFLSWAPVVWVGKRTYSMYLLHVLCVHVVLFVIPCESLGQYLTIIFIDFFVCIAAAYAPYRWIEQPAIRFGKRVIARGARNRRETAESAGAMAESSS